MVEYFVSNGEIEDWQFASLNHHEWMSWYDFEMAVEDNLISLSITFVQTPQKPVKGGGFSESDDGW